MGLKDKELSGKKKTQTAASHLIIAIGIGYSQEQVKMQMSEQNVF